MATRLIGQDRAFVVYAYNPDMGENPDNETLGLTADMHTEESFRMAYRSTSFEPIGAFKTYNEAHQFCRELREIIRG